MSSYGKVAKRVVEDFKSGRATNPRESWESIAQVEFIGRKSAQKKSCPMSAFLGLCEEGLVKYVPKGAYTHSVENKRYAIQAVNLLKENSCLTESQLWTQIDKGDPNKAPNEQMSVVKALFNEGLIIIRM
jgi:hypothetical protein